MNLGVNKVVKEGSGNTLIFTALLAGALANSIPTPFDAIYFRRINRLEREFKDGKISAEKLEYHRAGEYYLWTSLWYISLFSIVYVLGGKYKNNVKVLLALASGGIVLGAVSQNIKINKDIQKTKKND